MDYPGKEDDGFTTLGTTSFSYARCVLCIAVCSLRFYQLHFISHDDDARFHDFLYSSQPREGIIYDAKMPLING